MEAIRINLLTCWSALLPSIVPQSIIEVVAVAFIFKAILAPNLETSYKDMFLMPTFTKWTGTVIGGAIIASLFWVAPHAFLPGIAFNLGILGVLYAFGVVTCLINAYSEFGTNRKDSLRLGAVNYSVYFTLFFHLTWNLIRVVYG